MPRPLTLSRRFQGGMVALLLFRFHGDCRSDTVVEVLAEHAPPSREEQESPTCAAKVPPAGCERRNLTEVPDQVVGEADLSRFCPVGIDLGECNPCLDSKRCDLLHPPSAIGGLHWSISGYVYWFNTRQSDPPSIPPNGKHPQRLNLTRHPVSRAIDLPDETATEVLVRSRYYQYTHNIEWNEWQRAHRAYPAKPRLAQTHYAQHPATSPSPPGVVRPMLRVRLNSTLPATDTLLAKKQAAIAPNP